MKYFALVIMLTLAAPLGCKSKKDDETSEPATAEQAEKKDESAEKKPTDEVAQKDEGDAGPTTQPSKPSAEKAGLPTNLEAGETRRFGGEFSIAEPPVTLATAISRASNEEKAEPVKIEAHVEKVCKKKGCWFTLTEEDVEMPVRVRMKDYGFFVPRNSDGGKAIVEGTLTHKEISADEANHYREDAAEKGEKIEKVKGPQKVWQFTATAVEISNT